MIKLLDILKEIFAEGIKLDKKTGNTIISKVNDPNDLLLADGLRDAPFKGVNVKYSIAYNNSNPNAEDMAILADNIKRLKNIDQTQIHDLIKKDLEKLFYGGFKPKTVYYLDSSAPLSKLVGDIVKEIDSEINVLPLNKIKWPSSKDLLVDNYKELVNNSPEVIKAVETIAQNVWKNNNGKFKSTGVPAKYRVCFKPKYDLNKILEKNSLLFVDDNVQTGTDFAYIEEKFKHSPLIMFYAVVRLNKTGKKTTSASTAAKTNKLPPSFTFTKSDLQPLGKNGLGLRSTYDKIKQLQDKGYLEKSSITLDGKIYYLFKNKELKITDLI